MSHWKATMPREVPKDDHVHFVLAVKSGDSRHEFGGQISTLKAQMLSKLANMRDESLIETLGDLLPDSAGLNDERSECGRTLDPLTPDELCQDFRDEVFRKAGKEQPPTRANYFGAGEDRAVALLASAVLRAEERREGAIDTDVVKRALFMLRGQQAGLRRSESDHP